MNAYLLHVQNWMSPNPVLHLDELRVNGFLAKPTE